MFQLSRNKNKLTLFGLWSTPRWIHQIKFRLNIWVYEIDINCFRFYRSWEDLKVSLVIERMLSSFKGLILHSTFISFRPQNKSLDSPELAEEKLGCLFVN